MVTSVSASFAQDLTPTDSFRDAASKISAEVLVTGSFEKQGNSYFLQVTPVLIASAEWLPTLTATIEWNDFLESMFTPFPQDVPVLTNKAAAAGLSMPSCVYCRDPSYSNQARRAKFNGSAVFQVSCDGRARQICATKPVGYGLDEQSFYAIKKWKVRPARRTEDGEPVEFIVPIEVTFRLY